MRELAGLCRIVKYAEAVSEAAEARTRLLVVSLTAKPPVVKLESTIKAAQKPLTMKGQKATLKEKRKRDLEQRRANTFKEASTSCPACLLLISHAQQQLALPDL